ncbi:MAG TPA: hypothetical protein VKR31_14880 [Rhizomicrobium sp.]|nr:hypothetical protein [Rhizomicrobium sp.]
MFRMGLLTSSAMTAVALLLSGAPTGAWAQTGMHVASRDPNTRFLCTYGAFRVDAEAAAHVSESATSEWEHVAVPVTGHGQTVSRIRVVEESGSGSDFSAGIYTNSPSGFPGKRIAGGRGVASSCGSVTISIAPTRLKRHKTYWIEETTSPQCYPLRVASHGNRRLAGRPPCSSSFTSVYWAADRTQKRMAYVQTHRATYCSSHTVSCYSSSTTSPWTKQTKGPYLKLE